MESIGTKNQQSNHKLNIIIGNWATKTLMLDFDNTPLGEVKLWCFRLYVWFGLGGFIILQSSQRILAAKDKRTGKIIFRYRIGSYLVVFNREVTWKQNVRIMNWIALESGNIGLQNYVRMQCIKGSSTLRLSNKGKKPFPKPIFHHGSQDKMIAEFLDNRQFILDFLNNSAC